MAPLTLFVFSLVIIGSKQSALQKGNRCGEGCDPIEAEHLKNIIRNYAFDCLDTLALKYLMQCYCESNRATCAGEHIMNCLKRSYPTNGTTCSNNCSSDQANKIFEQAPEYDYNCLDEVYFNSYIDCICAVPRTTCPQKYYNAC